MWVKVRFSRKRSNLHDRFKEEDEEEEGSVMDEEEVSLSFSTPLFLSLSLSFILISFPAAQRKKKENFLWE